jgi:hypothetical protein
MIPQNVIWTESLVRANHGKSLWLWWQREKVPKNRLVMLWIIYEEKIELCSLYDKGDILQQAHRISAKEMAEYLNKFSATLDYINWSEEKE